MCRASAATINPLSQLAILDEKKNEKSKTYEPILPLVGVECEGERNHALLFRLGKNKMVAKFKSKTHKYT